MKEKISNQIAVYKTQKVLLEMQNCLKPAPKEFPWHIHASGKEEGYSLIQLVAMDYSDENETISVYANLGPDTVLYLYAQLCLGYGDVLWEEQKIFKDKEKGGVVTRIRIERNETHNGEKRSYPWFVNIANGKGEVAYNRNGGQYCRSGTYEEEKSVSVYLSDVDFFRLLNRTCAVIRAFEQKTLYRDREVRNFQTLYRLIKKELLFLRTEDDRQDTKRDAA